MRKLCFYLLVAFVFSVPWQNAISIGGIRTLSSLLGIAAVVITLLMRIHEARIARPRGIVFAAGAFVVWQLTTYLWSMDETLTVSTLLTLFQLLGLVWLVSELVRTEPERLVVMQAFVLGCLVVCAVLVQAYASGQAMDGYRYAPANFSLNGAASTLALGIPMALLLCARAWRSPLLWVNIAYVPLAVFSVILTASRSGFAATCLALAGVAVVLARARPAYRVALFALVLAITIGLFVWIQGNRDLATNIERVTLGTETYSVKTLTGRTNIWAAGLRVFAEHPATGIGTGTFSLAMQQQIGVTTASHNLFILVLAESGFVGLLSLVAVLVTSVAPVLRQGTQDIGLQVILFLVLMVMASVANAGTSKTLWLVLALLSAARPPGIPPLSVPPAVRVPWS